MKKILAFAGILAILFAPSASAETVRIVAEDDWYPYTAKSDNGPVGITVDLVKAAFKAEGVDVEFDVMNYDRGMEITKDGEAIACFNAPRTDEIENSYYWHDDLLFVAGGYFYARSDFERKIEGVQDAAGMLIGLTQGYGYGDKVDSDTAMNKEYSKNDTVLLQKLLAKRLDAIIIFEKVADQLIAKLGIQGQVKQVGLADNIYNYVAFSKKHPEGKKYRDIFNEGLKKIQADGTFDRIMKDWDVKIKSLPTENAQPPT